MEFGWSDEAREVHERMRALGARAQAAEPDERLDVLAKGGALGLSLPREFGGAGLDHRTTAYAYEGLGRVLSDGGVLLAAGAHLFGVASMIAKVGTPEQQRAYLPALASGERIATVAATEVGAGSDVASVESIAERAPHGGFRVTGEKRFVTWADRADLFFTIARDGKEGRGLTALLLPRSPAVRAGALLPTAGLRGARLAPVSIEGAEVSSEALLGRPGAGLAVFQIAMTFERALVLAFRLGAMDSALERAIAFARTRTLGGHAIAKHQAVAHRIARMRLRLETARLLTYRAAWELDRGGRGQLEAALAKWHLASSAVESAIDDFRLRGGAGFMEDSGAPAAIDDALGGSIHSGTEDVLATIVAKWLGL
jgi:alkylation response protein AidB-like acyl-CoA dehydrogenase